MIIHLKQVNVPSQPRPGCTCSSGINAKIYTCNDCKERYKLDISFWKNCQKENMERITAPFTTQQIEMLNAFQNLEIVHPFTCGLRENHISNDILIATPLGWICPENTCFYTQNWAWEFMTNQKIIEERIWIQRLLSGEASQEDKTRLAELSKKHG